MSAEITKCMSKDTKLQEDQKTDGKKRDKPHSVADHFDTVVH